LRISHIPIFRFELFAGLTPEIPPVVWRCTTEKLRGRETSIYTRELTTFGDRRRKKDTHVSLKTTKISEARRLRDNYQSVKRSRALGLAKADRSQMRTGPQQRQWIERHPRPKAVSDQNSPARTVNNTHPVARSPFEFGIAEAHQRFY
jgi:hypothetical protein